MGLLFCPEISEHVGVVDWQEEVYQKIKSMEEMYFPELHELYQRVAMKCQQHDEALVPQPNQSDRIEKVKRFKRMLECIITFFKVPKSNISPDYMEKLPRLEKQIANVIALSQRLRNRAIAQRPELNGVGLPQQS